MMSKTSNAAVADVEDDVPGFTDVKYVLDMVPTGSIEKPEFALRDAQRDLDDYKDLRDSIAEVGIFKTLLVRPLPPSEDGTPRYSLIDGLQRLSCAQDLGLPLVPVRVVDMDDFAVAKAQIIANAVQLMTKPVNFVEAMRRIFMSQPTLSVAEMARDLNRSEKWVNDMLSLNKLHETLKPLVNDGHIKTGHAFVLAKIRPDTEQLRFAEQAQVMSLSEFTPLVNEAITELRNAARQARDPNRERTYPPVLRKVKELQEVLADPILVAKNTLESEGVKTLEDAFLAGIKFATQTDAASIARRKTEQELLDAKTKEAAALRAAETAEKKRKEAAEKAAAAHQAREALNTGNEGEVEDEAEEE